MLFNIDLGQDVVSSDATLWVINRVHEPIVTSGRRSNTDDGGVEIKLPQAFVLAPVDIGQLRSLCLGNLNLGATHRALWDDLSNAWCHVDRKWQA